MTDRRAETDTGQLSATNVTIRTRPATSDSWPDVVAAFGRRGKDPNWCWCQRFMHETPADAPADGTNRDALQIEIEQAKVAPGLIAYLDDVPIGWTRVMPRSEVPGVARNNALRRVLDDEPGAWWITCFVVDQRSRKQGVATALLKAAVDHAAQNGAICVEGHPVDTDALRSKSTSGSALFTGTMRTFVAAGFHEVVRTYASRPVMRIDIASA